LSTESGLTTVYVAKRTVAEIIKSRLESEGIPAILQYESAGLIFALTVDGLGEARVMVPDYLAEEARQILQTPGTEEIES